MTGHALHAMIQRRAAATGIDGPVGFHSLRAGFVTKTLLEGMEWGTWPGGLTAARDAFIVLAGFAGALRRSELAALILGDRHRHPADGLHRSGCG